VRLVLGGGGGGGWGGGGGGGGGHSPGLELLEPMVMANSCYRLNFDLDKKNEIQHHT
jgi:hypothetical protein